MAGQTCILIYELQIHDLVLYDSYADLLFILINWDYPDF